MLLNSRRVTRPVLRLLAAELGLPTTASNEDLRQMVDGKRRHRTSAERRAGGCRTGHRRGRKTRMSTASRRRRNIPGGRVADISDARRSGHLWGRHPRSVSSSH